MKCPRCNCEFEYNFSKCPECGYEMSDRADAAPQKPKKTSKVIIAAACAAVVICAGTIVWAVVNNDSISSDSEDDTSYEEIIHDDLSSLALGDFDNSSRESDLINSTVSKAESKAEESTAEKSIVSESKADESIAEVEVGYADGVYTGEKYTIEADPAVWTYGEGAGTDCQFTYAGDLDDDMAVTANFNVVSMSDEWLRGTSVSEYAEDMRSSYESTDGYEVTTAEPGTLNGVDSYTFTISYKISDDVTMEIHQVVVSKDDTLVAISYGAADSVISKLDSEFEKVLDSFKFN